MADPFDDSVQAPPTGVRVEQRGESLRIERRWFSRPAVVLAVIAAAWNGFVIYLYGFGDPAGAADPGPFRLLPPILIAIGLALVYAALARCLNSTAIELTVEAGGDGPRGRVLRVRHGPMPWPGRVTVAAADIERLYLEAHRSESSRARGRFGMRHTYSINGRMRGGGTLRLVSNIERPEQAGFIIRRLERAMGLGRDRREPEDRG